ncbi:MAG: class I SAM-dependent methyltransferase [Solirubrobacterales bacterium]|nr:class I SAM-dependent methyltransferase [Solirubrobacterales bacterium]
MTSDERFGRGLGATAGDTKAHPALPLVRPVIGALQRINRALRWLSTQTHRLQGAVEGRFDRRRMWFDHYIDVNYNWLAQGDATFLERGLFNRMCLSPDADVLEIACGDGFYTRHFYAAQARSVLAIDIDPAALEFARRVNSRENVRYEVRDIRLGLPQASVTHVIWDNAMIFLTEEQLAEAVDEIHARIGQTGKFSGYVAYEPHLHQPFVRHTFRDSEGLAEFLKRSFEHALVFRTEYGGRVNYYFVASDMPLAAAVPAIVANADVPGV